MCQHAQGSLELICMYVQTHMHTYMVYMYLTGGSLCVPACTGVAGTDIYICAGIHTYVHDMYLTEGSVCANMHGVAGPDIDIYVCADIHTYIICMYVSERRICVCPHARGRWN